VLALLSAAAVAEAAPPDLVARARLFYNRRQFDAAIETARAAARQPAHVDSAAVVLAHAHLERHRLQGSADDLTAAHEALVAIDPARLSTSEGSEFVVAWGELHFLEDRPGVAAELFDAALAGSGLASAAARDRILDWWAQSLDRLARDESQAGRHLLYVRILVRMEQEGQRAPRSAVVPYWLAAAARGSGNLDRAWDAAVAGWIRAKLTPGGGAGLRADLDTLVTSAVIPERARLAVSEEEAHYVLSDMRAEWELTKRIR
jgi:hypothetical protein